MDWKKIAPWNWFKDEESNASMARLPAARERASSPYAAFRTEMDRLFDDAFRGSLRPGADGLSAIGASAQLRPKVDISEGKKAYTVRAELPGIEQDAVTVEAEGQTLVIRADKRQEREEEDEGYHWIERSYGAVQRVLSLPEDADVEAIDARFKNGVLKLRIPKHPARVGQGRSIDIRRG